MWSLIKSEWLKMRRCQILLVGIVAVSLCPVVQYGTQLVIRPDLRDPNYDMAHLFANVIWGNTQIFIPISLVMIGGWLIDREAANDTMKNLLTVPVSLSRLLGAKLIVTAILAVLFETYKEPFAPALCQGHTFDIRGERRANVGSLALTRYFPMRCRFPHICPLLL